MDESIGSIKEAIEDAQTYFEKSTEDSVVYRVRAIVRQKKALHEKYPNYEEVINEKFKQLCEELDVDPIEILIDATQADNNVN